MFQTKVIEEIKTQILFSVSFYHILSRLGVNLVKYDTAEQARNGNMTHAHCIPKVTHTNTHTQSQNM
jgi:hypothetical protein